MTTDAEYDTMDQAKERAAIKEYCGGMSRDDAEKQTASEYGYSSWHEMIKESK